jgi:acyl-CoA synthetase (AMP-forming)/AMP-acid ligase II
VEGAADYAALIAAGRREAAAAVVDRDAPAWVLFTSGTSGRAKGAVLTQRNVCNMITNLDYMRESAVELRARLSGVPAETVREHTPPLVSFLIYPLFHVSGLSVMWNALLKGGTMVARRRWDAIEAARAIVEHKVSVLSAPPLVLHDLLALPDAARVLGGLVQIGAGGQATPVNLARRMREVAPGAVQGGGWGMTETAAAFDGEWYRTGGVGHVDEDGFVYVIDRLTDMVISGGENIHCAEVEKALAATDDFVEVAVFGVPDVRLGERTVAAVRPRGGLVLGAEEIRSAVGRALADYKVPSEVVFPSGPFPRTATGKVEKAKLRAAFLAGEA